MDERTLSEYPSLRPVPASDVDGDGHRLASYEELMARVANLQAAMEHRPVIDMAKGILIARTGCDPAQAFQLLVAQSQAENRKLRELAEELVRRNVRTPGHQTDGDGRHDGAGGA